MESAKAFLTSRLDEQSYQRLKAIRSPQLHEFLSRHIEFCNPATVFVNDDSPESMDHIRQAALKNGEEGMLAIPGHTYHFDAFDDQGRDKKNTAILLPAGESLGSAIDTKEREAGYAEVHEMLKGIMSGREMYVSFYCLGPAKSVFTIPCVQITDSSYVVHNEHLLYRPGYEEFVRRGEARALEKFYRFVHSQGEVDERKVCKNLDKRRIFIDLHHDIVYSINTQYGGNSIGLKKLAMRLAILQASKEGWLNEHMLVLGVRGPNGRLTYFSGAYPSMCGKTSTAMLEGESMVGDDIVYIRNVDGAARVVNAERGMFGIIQGINPKDDPLLWKALNNPNEIIFSNVLVKEDGGVHWIDKGGDLPLKGVNHSGDWYRGKTDANGKPIRTSHPNARFTLSLKSLDTVDTGLDDPAGFNVGAMVYGGRDSDTWVPVEEAFDWTHGIITKGAILESETTAATLGQEGVREINPMANIDFLSVTVGTYIRMNLAFAKGLKKTPLIFSVNYFLRGIDGGWLNERSDKAVWYKWMELRVHGDVQAIDTPTGRIPLYADLKRLFAGTIRKDYTETDYANQFTIRIPENLAKIERVTKFYTTRVADTPKVFFDVLEDQRKRLLEYREKYGDYPDPEVLGG
ncbi:MAG TPA: phosphoenolpyruvate carboxykinase (GTP) [Dissulfurispiraceae bacterium]|nr:phosphoenolpyruvate carboxykinase (GTP) [Dissulfurispiraceae bacterium]